MRARAAAAAAIAVACGAMLAFDRWAAPDAVPDFDHVWFAARAMLEGRDPYALIGPGREYPWPWPLYYPLTAPASLLPLAPLPIEAARLLFVCAPAALLAFLLSRDGFARLALFASGAFLMAVKTAQWGPLILCGLLVPWIGLFIAAKPNLGLGALAGARSAGSVLRMVAGASAVLVVSIVLQPSWPARWLAVVAGAPQPLSIVTLTGGPLLLLSMLRWRRWDARLLLACALVPQTGSAVGTLPLLLVPRTFRSLLVMGILSYVPAFLAPRAGESMESWARRENLAALLAVYLPMLWLVLREPNRGPAPPWLERVVSRWPSWIRGEPGLAVDPVSLDDPPTARDRVVSSAS